MVSVSCRGSFLQTGQGLQRRSIEGRERAGGNPQGYRRVWRKAVQQTAAVRCEEAEFNSGVLLFKLRHTHTHTLKNITTVWFQSDDTTKKSDCKALNSDDGLTFLSAWWGGFGGFDPCWVPCWSISGRRVSDVLHTFLMLIDKVWQGDGKSYFSWLCLVCLSCSWSSPGGSRTAPPLWPSSTQQILQWEVRRTLTDPKD